MIVDHNGDKNDCTRIKIITKIITYVHEDFRDRTRIITIITITKITQQLYNDYTRNSDCKNNKTCQDLKK